MKNHAEQKKICNKKEKGILKKKKKKQRAFLNEF